MKVFTSIVLAICAVCVNAEAPGYPASGWKPNGRLLALPSRVQEAPKPVYGPPTTFSPPSNSYGPPSTTVEFGTSTITDFPNTTPAASGEESNETEGSGSAEGASSQQQDAPNVESGLYYVLLPDGRLQRVEYVTAPLAEFESEKQTAFQGFPGFQVKPLKLQNQPTNAATQFQVGAFQGNQNQGFNSNQNNQAQSSGSTFGFNKVQFKGKYQSAAFIQPITAPAEPAAPVVQTQYLLAPNPAAVSAFGSFQQYQAEKAQAAQIQAAQQQAQQQQAAVSAFASFQQYQADKAQAAQQQSQQQQAAPAVPAFQGFVSNVQYKDVEPITAPVYAYNSPQNFARILKREV